MQQKLIALAVAGALAAPAAFAATANVDVYGQMDFSFNWVNSDVSGTGVDGDDLVTGKSNASRIGFKGSEDLGGGMKALWQIETGFLQGNDNNSTGYDGGFRNTFVGLSGSWGTVLLGRHDTPYKLATGKLDVFGDNIGDYNAIISSKSGIFGSAPTGFDQRVDQTVAYITPTLFGFHAALAYVGLREDADAGVGQKNKGAYSMMAMYESGPIFASLAHEKHSGGAGASVVTSDVTGTKIGLGYNFGSARLNGVYEATSETGNTAWDRNAWWVGGDYKMGNLTLRAAYGERGDSKAASTDDSGKFFALGAVYSLSKRTNVYLTYAMADDAPAGNVVPFGMSAGNDGAGGNGNEPSVLAIGVRHSF